MTDSTEVMVFEGEEFTEEGPPKNAVMFLLWLQRQLADVNACYRNEVRIEIRHRRQQRGFYIKLSYPRPAPGVTGELAATCQQRAAA